MSLQLTLSISLSEFAGFIFILFGKTNSNASLKLFPSLTRSRISKTTNYEDI